MTLGFRSGARVPLAVFIYSEPETPFLLLFHGPKTSLESEIYFSFRADG
jgi:hypothetical protein